jgi:hypothetical protein
MYFMVDSRDITDDKTGLFLIGIIEFLSLEF